MTNVITIAGHRPSERQIEDMAKRTAKRLGEVKQPITTGITVEELEAQFSEQRNVFLDVIKHNIPLSTGIRNVRAEIVNTLQSPKDADELATTLRWIYSSLGHALDKYQDGIERLKMEETESL